MPQILRREGSPFWYGRFQFHGKDMVFSTGERDREKARQVLKWRQGETKGTLEVDDLFAALLKTIDRLNGEAKDDEDRRRLNQKRQDMARRLIQSQAEKLPISVAWSAWLENPKKRNPSDSTVGMYQGQWKRFQSWAEHRHVENLHEVTRAQAEEYASDLWKSNVAPGTFNHHVKFLRGMFTVLKTQAGLMTNPWDEIPLMPVERESRRNFTPAELAAICKKATGALRYMIGLGLYTGMRLADVLNLKWENVDFKSGRIEHVPMKTRRINKKVVIPIHTVLRALLTELRSTPHGDYLFSVERKIYEVNSSAISNRIQEFFQSCGIQTQEKPVNGHRQRAIVRVGFHSLRHSFVSLCAASRVPQVAIMELVGHGSPAMTALYSHAGDEQKAKAIAALPSIDFKHGKSR
ncbi:MAG: site-specific integrase [Kiritimatiellia bacterium]|nr:site-specific integrase [Kiritimatiellia bacterium]